MSEISTSLQALLDRVPRRHNSENVREIYTIIDAYEELLTTLGADSRYETVVAPYYDALDDIRTSVKKSNDPKASKNGKDVLFDEASGNLKDNLAELIGVLQDAG